jgi:hypothetical protein
MVRKAQSYASLAEGEVRASFAVVHASKDGTKETEKVNNMLHQYLSFQCIFNILLSTMIVLVN